ncbi:MAG TPA: class II aldolase/adducin family protein [Dongiaceae bacterium]|jgi:rhamnose utilization protein RhaD (predicted bifunctional aldolase and dehydrogenase)|nr:class II aldolase/adducin family protein [Dongiaceae bacterium]
MTTAALDDLRRMSARVGRDITLVQGAGGNSSVKLGDVLWVKASGAWLSDAEAKEVFVPVDLAGARRALAAGSEKMPVAEGFGGIGLRASIETALHALLPHPVVLHVHAVNAIAWAVRADGDAELAARLDGLNWRSLPYRRPGLPLSQAVAEITASAPADVLVLGNHGLVVGAAGAGEAEALALDVERRLVLPPRAAPAADGKRLNAVCAGSDYRPAGDPVCHALATDARNLEIATAGSLYPDHVVFLGPALPTLPEKQSLGDLAARAAAQGVPAPVAVLVPGAGAAIRKDASAGAEPMLICLGLVATRLPAAAPVRYLPAAEEQALLDWDAERYRQQLMAAHR